MSMSVDPEVREAVREHRRPRAGRGPQGRGEGREETAMWQDLAALTPPLVVCVAFLIGVAVLLRREMAPKRRADRNSRRRSDDQGS